MSEKSGMIVRQFEAQFTPDGGGYLYRRGMRGAAIRVSAAERDAFMARYSGSAHRLWWAFTGGMVAAMLVLAIIYAAAGIDPRAGRFEALMAGTLIVLMAAYLWLAGRLASAPARALADRPVAAPPLDRPTFMRARRRAQSWSTFVIGPVGVAFLWLRFGPRSDLLAGGHAAWSLGAAAYLAFMAFFALEKWRAEHRDDARLTER